MTEPVEPQRRRPTVEDVFGDVLPDTTRDERPTTQDESRDDDSWYLDNRPPHHDRT